MESQHSGAPGTAAPPVGHGSHRPGSPQGVLLKMGQGHEMVRQDAKVRTWGYHKASWLPGAWWRLQDHPTRSPHTASLSPPLGPLWDLHLVPDSPGLLTQLVEDVQELMGHDAASSAVVHGSRETGLSYPQNPSRFLAPILSPQFPSITHHNMVQGSWETASPPSQNGLYLG